MFEDKPEGSLAPAFSSKVLGAQLWRPELSHSSGIQPHYKAKDGGVSGGAQNPAMKVEKGFLCGGARGGQGT